MFKAADDLMMNENTLKVYFNKLRNEDDIDIRIKFGKAERKI